MSIYNSIDETFSKIIENKEFPPEKTADIEWVGKYMETFYEYAKECTGHIAEIGVNKVCSSWSWAKARPKKITLCDIRLYERGGIWLDSFVKLCSEEGIEVVLENKSSVEMNLENVDLLFIDGLHSYDHVKMELEKFAPQVNKYIIFHDTVLKSEKVNRAATDFLKSTDSWVEEHRRNDSPGILIIKRIK